MLSGLSAGLQLLTIFPPSFPTFIKPLVAIYPKHCVLACTIAFQAAKIRIVYIKYTPVRKAHWVAIREFSWYRAPIRRCEA
jgi:hypothetical protein